MFIVNDNLSVKPLEDGVILLKAKQGDISIDLKINAHDWIKLVNEFPVGDKSMFDETRKAHEKFVQLPIPKQLAIGVDIGVITEDEAKTHDSLKLHNKILTMIYGDEAEISACDTFITEVERAREELQSRQGA